MISEEDLKQHKIRELGPDGRLVRAGLWWRESRPVLNNLLMIGSGLLFISATVAAILGVVAFFNARIAAGVGWIVLGLAAYAGMRWMGQVGAMFQYFRRTVIFADDGSVSVEHQPRGLNLYDCTKPAALTTLPGKHSAISSIEMRLDEKPLENPNLKPGETRPAPAKTFSVFIFFRDGQQYWSSQYLLEHEARWVVVQLMEALKEMRTTGAAHSPVQAGF